MARSLSELKKVIKVAAESTPGVMPDISTSKAVLALDTLKVVEMKPTMVDINTIKGYFGNNEQIVAFYDATVDFEIPLAVGGVTGSDETGGIPTPGTAPVYAPLIKACNFTQSTISADITGTAQGGDLNTITLAAGASPTDNIYTGMFVYVEMATGTAQATVAKNQITLAASTAKADDYFNDYFVKINHYVDKAAENTGLSKESIKIVPADVGDNNILNLTIAVKTGANAAETRRVKAYDTTTGKVTFSKSLSVMPTSATTYTISESKKIIDYVGATDVATLESKLKIAVSATATYEIAEKRIAGGYNGTTKDLEVFPRLTKEPGNDTVYIIGANVRYEPNSDIDTDQESCSMWFEHDGQYYEFRYCKGTVSFSFDSGSFPKAKFTFTGLLGQWATDTIGAFDLLTWVKPVAVNYAHTKNINVHGYTGAVVETLSIDSAVTVVHRNKPGSDKVLITDRKMTGSLQIEKPVIDDFDYISAVRDADKGVVAFSHGVLDNQMIVYMPKVQLGEPDTGNSDGVSTVTFKTMILPAGSGGKEFYLTLAG
jgi:hypothetical protein